jgi:(1->4)-alpha-D-glucan 1-alpha-D-glucosylmutase
MPPDSSRPLWVVAEKILSSGEHLPANWAVHGTTGYDYLNDLNGVFVDASQGRRLQRAYAKLTGETDPFEDVLYASKRLIMETAMSSELNVLAHMLDRIGEGNRRSRDFTLDSLRSVIAEVVACFPVYRTYVDERGWVPEDRAVVVRAVARARRRNPAMEASLFDFLLEVVLPRAEREAPDEQEASRGGDSRRPDRRTGYPPVDAREAAERRRFAMKLQQYTGPVQAKGLEDTAFYRYNLLLSLNEVGGDAARVGRSPAEFHAANAYRLAHWPFGMLATSTHDTKLGEDVRARVNVLSEMPDEWSRDVSRWMRMNRTHRTLVDGEPAPDRNDEYRFYQALAGAWPVDGVASGFSRTESDTDFVDRMKKYMIKAVKEAKRHTSWLTPNEQYESAVLRFVEGVLTGSGRAKFLPAFLPSQERIAQAGMVNSLAQLTLKLGSPGIPDFYQGTELWDLSLVDPDNRRPVDFALRARLLEEVDEILSLGGDARRDAAADLLRRWPDGRIKLLLTAAGVRLRRDEPGLFFSGEYLPLETETSVSGGIVAFARTLGERAALFVAPRLVARLMASTGLPTGGAAWKTSRVLLPPNLAGRTFRHILTDAELRPSSTDSHSWLFAGEIFETVPFGILVG